jgi:hypothetical protein
MINNTANFYHKIISLLTDPQKKVQFNLEPPLYPAFIAVLAIIDIINIPNHAISG